MICYHNPSLQGGHRGWVTLRNNRGTKPQTRTAIPMKLS